MVSTTNDLKAICAEEGAYDGETPEDEDGNTTNSFVHTVKFDMSEAIENAEEGFFAPSKHHHFGRKLVWWQQLCEPTVSAMEALCRSLEVETPQLQCFAEACQHKKATEEVAFDALVKAHNKFEVVFEKYTDEVYHYNDMISQKNTALATTISAYESFHPVQAGMTQQYDKDVYNFEKFDSGADKGHCGLSDCQVEAICSHKYKKDFEFWVDTDACEATPHDTKICHPPPSPPPPPRLPCRRRPCRRTPPGRFPSRWSLPPPPRWSPRPKPPRNPRWSPRPKPTRNPRSPGRPRQRSCRLRLQRLGSGPSRLFRRRRKSSRTPSLSSLRPSPSPWRRTRLSWTSSSS